MARSADFYGEILGGVAFGKGGKAEKLSSFRSRDIHGMVILLAEKFLYYLAVCDILVKKDIFWYAVFGGIILHEKIFTHFYAVVFFTKEIGSLIKKSAPTIHYNAGTSHFAILSNGDYISVTNIVINYLLTFSGFLYGLDTVTKLCGKLKVKLLSGFVHFLGESFN